MSRRRLDPLALRAGDLGNTPQPSTAGVSLSSQVCVAPRAAALAAAAGCGRYDGPPTGPALRLNKTASRRVGLSFNPIAVGFAEEDHCRYQRTFAQSPSRFDTATFQLGLPYLRDAGPLPQVALSDLQRLVVEPIVCEPFRWPSGCLLRQCWPLGEATPKLLVRPCQAQLRT
jgi:hypothetical protein